MSILKRVEEMMHLSGASQPAGRAAQRLGNTHFAGGGGGGGGGGAFGHLQEMRPMSTINPDGSPTGQFPGYNRDALLYNGVPASGASLGTDDNGPLQAMGFEQIQPQGKDYRLYNNQLQGGRFNPGLLPLQQSNIRYRQNPQPTQPWYDF